MARRLEASRILIYSNSQLIVNQITEEYQAKDVRMKKYLSKPKALLPRFEESLIKQIPRSENSNADALVKLTSAYDTDLARSIPVKILDASSILKGNLIEIEVQPVKISH